MGIFCYCAGRSQPPKQATQAMRVVEFGEDVAAASSHAGHFRLSTFDVRYVREDFERAGDIETKVFEGQFGG